MFLLKQMLRGQIEEEYYKKYTNILKSIVKQAKCMSNNEYIVRAENKSKAT